jgi:putative ABC transport system permease protein
MSLWRQLTRGLRALTHRREADAELNDEVLDYLDRTADANVANGMSRSAAYRAARVELGNPTVTRERVRDATWERSLETLIADVRYGLRRLRTNPGFTAVSAITLALGIGATTVIFSAINPILFEPLPYPNADRVLMVSDATNNGTPEPIAFGTYREILLRNHSFAALAPFKAWQPTLEGGAEPERLNGQAVGADYFRALGVTPVRGRDFTADDDRDGGPTVAVLSDALWHRRFGGDPAIVGRTVTLDDYPVRVIGVMPPAFENVPDANAEIWTPLQYRTVFTPDSREWGHHLRLVGRVRSGVDLAAARTDLNAIARSPRADMPRVPWASLQAGLIVTSLQADVARDARPALLAVFGAVLVLLIIACVNVTNLLLARGAQRRGEFALRAALGAERGRLVRQLITESMMLSLLGGALGMLVAGVGLRSFVAMSPVGLPRLGSIHVDASALVFALVVTSVIGLAVGVLPALHASREDLQAGLQEASRRSAGQHHGTRRVLVVAEVALSLVLLVGAGLLLRSLERVFAVNVGFDASNLLTMQVQLTGQRYRPDDVKARFLDDALAVVRRVPGVSAAAFTQQLPLSGDLDVYGAHLERNSNPKDDGAVLRYAVTPDYFTAMRIPLVRGRFLDSHDVAGAPRAVVINESFARAEFGKDDAIGQRMHVGPDDGQWYTVVGVVGDVKQAIDALDNRYAVYTAPTQWHWVDNLHSLVVRTQAAGDASSLAASVRNAIWSVDKNQPVVRISTMSSLVTTATAGRRFALVLFEAFGIAALVLAAVGIYGVLSGSVTERIREIGVRSAMGASPRDILGLILGQGMKLTLAGVVLGLVGAAVATRGLVTLLFGVTRLDPVTYAGVIALLLGVSVVACWMPAWRAARIDPAVTLRSE